MDLLKRVITAYQVPPLPQAQRDNSLDWLRVIAFGILIFYHIGMLYSVNWSFHIKSQYQTAWVEGLMLLVNPWRMPLLWLISGVATRFFLSKLTNSEFIWQRSVRLLLPLLVGILLIVPPQLYCEMRYLGETDIGFWQFMRRFYLPEQALFAQHQAGIWPHIDVNHLWYLRELWQLTLGLLLIIPLLHAPLTERIILRLLQRPLWQVLGLFALPSFMISVLFSETRIAQGGYFLLLGYLLLWRAEFWQRLLSTTQQLLWLASASAIFLVLLYQLWWQHQPTEPVGLVFGAGYFALHQVLCLCAILALAKRYLTRANRWLKYLAEAVYPCYLLHQTFLIVICFALTPYQLGPLGEPLLVVGGTIVGCLVGFESIRRINWLRPLFGLRNQRILTSWLQRGLQLATALVLIPFALEILF